MFDLEAARHLVARELDAIQARADTLTREQWATEIPWLPGWTVLSLVDHNGYAASQQAESFENVVAGTLDVPTYPTITGGTPDQTLTRLKDGRERLVASLAAVTAGHLDQPTPLPFATMPTAVALQIPVLEYAYHRWDLERALGNDDFDVPDDIAAGGFGFSAGLLPMLAGGGASPDTPLAFELVTPAATMTFEHAGGPWAVVEFAAPDTAVCRVEGSTSDVVMFTFGRLPAEALTVTGSAPEAAPAFKSYFPGP